jgi:hypothetical protein
VFSYSSPIGRISIYIGQIVGFQTRFRQQESVFLWYLLWFNVCTPKLYPRYSKSLLRFFPGDTRWVQYTFNIWLCVNKSYKKVEQKHEIRSRTSVLGSNHSFYLFALQVLAGSDSSLILLMKSIKPPRCGPNPVSIPASYLRQIKRFRRTTGEPWRVIDPPSPTSLLAASGGGRAELFQEESRGVRVFNVRGEKTSENPWECDWSGQKKMMYVHLCSWFSLYFILIVSVIFPCSPRWEPILIPIDLQVSFNHHPRYAFPKALVSWQSHPQISNNHGGIDT